MEKTIQEQIEKEVAKIEREMRRLQHKLNGILKNNGRQRTTQKL